MASGLLVYQNGRYVPDAEAAVSVFDPGVMFGYMVFDVTRTFAGEPFRLRGKWGHLERLYASMKRVGIDCGMDINQMEAATRATIERNRGHFADGDDYMIRQYVSNGPPPGVPGLPAEPTVVIYLQPLREMLAPRAPFYAAGVAARITNQRSVPARLIDPKVKNTSRIYYRLAQAQAELVDRDAWALMTDEDGFITEGPAWSFMIVQDGVLISPEPRNILMGVTRSALIDVAAEVGVPFVEKNIDAYDVINANEAIFCTTSFVMLPVATVDGHTIGPTIPGPVTDRLREGFIALTGVDYVALARRFAAEVA